MKKATTYVFLGLLGTASPVLAAGDATAGKAVYAKECQSCHGATGEPNAKIATALKVEMKALGSPEVQALSDEQWKKIISEGQGKMKPTKRVQGKALDDVIAYARTLKK